MSGQTSFNYKIDKKLFNYKTSVTIVQETLLGCEKNRKRSDEIFR